MLLQRCFEFFHKNQTYNRTSIRTIFSKTKIWDETYSIQYRKDLELFWKDKVMTSNKAAKDQPKYYVLSMFPYPSGKLHMGHVRVYTISDVMARYKRMQGYDVIHPMGWDAFGLPAENAAIEQNVEPAVWTKNNIEIMKKQLLSLGCKFDWEREISTCDGSYYKWTQYLFVKLFEAGLVYQKMAPVNWDPIDKTVLADEQVDEEGRSWRSGAQVKKVPLKQWYVKTTAFSKSLVDGLSEVNPDLWKDVVNLQKNWIGKCDGARFSFKLKAKQNLSEADADLLSLPFDLFTRHPEAIHVASHVVIHSSHILNLPQFLDKDHSSTNASDEVRRLNVTVVNPFSGVEMPIFVSEKFPFDEHLDYHIGIPSVDENDRAFALNHGLQTIEVAVEESSLPANSDEMSGLVLEVEKLDNVLKAKKLGVGGHVTSAKARDWLISRQRYWGTPIPIVHCPKYGAVPVSVEELPVLLPEKITLSPSEAQSGHASIKSPLANNSQWLKTKCSKCDCDGHGIRETDTMDTFVDSSWYFLRYLDPKNEKLPFQRHAVDRFMPVDLYIGGKEHATMHLYYARFLCHFLSDLQLLGSREPFKNLLTQGMVLGQSYKLADTGKYLRPENVEKLEGGKYVEKDTGKQVVTEWEKMSKSKFNGVDPQEVLEKFGRDATRICILSNSAPKSDRPWSNEAFVGIERWQKRLWNLVHRFVTLRKSTEFDQRPNDSEVEILNSESSAIDESRNNNLLQVKHHMDNTFLLNTAISRMQILSAAISKSSDVTVAKSPSFERALCDLIVTLGPFAPSFASELWSGVASVEHLISHSSYDWELDVLDQSFPKADDNYQPILKVKVNNKDASEIRLPMVYSEMKALLTSELAWKLAVEDENFLKFMNSSYSNAESTDKSIWECKISSKKLTVYGDSKAELEVNLKDKGSKQKTAKLSN